MLHWVKHAAKAALKCVPAKPMLLRRLAALPPATKYYPVYRLGSAVAAVAGHQSPLTTNLGMSRAYSFQVTNNSLLAFGRPAYYRGERGALELAGGLSRHVDAFVDVGAHLGYYTFFVRQSLPAACPIYFFEPDLDLFTLTQKNVATSQLQNVHGFQVAVGSSDGEAVFYKDLLSPLEGSLVHDPASTHRVREIRVPILRFESFAAKSGFSRALVKVDVENAENDFLEGASAALGRIAFLIIEVLGPAHRGGFVQRLMQAAGMRAYYICDREIQHSSDGLFRYVEPDYNWLFCRLAPDELRQVLRGTGLQVRA